MPRLGEVEPLEGGAKPEDGEAEAENTWRKYGRKKKPEKGRGGTAPQSCGEREEEAEDPKERGS